MVSTPTAPTTELIRLSGIRWETYERLLQELSERRLRLTYCRGELEILSPSPEHEFAKKLLGRLVETLAEEANIPIYPLGSTTFKRVDVSGAEPDECFYFREIESVQGKKRLDLTEDPPPDLVIEIDVTSSSRLRLQVYADLGVPEVWIYDGELLAIHQLQDKNYSTAQESQFFPGISIFKIADFLQQANTTDYLTLVKQFRCWVQEQIGN